MSADRSNWPSWVPDDPRIVGWSIDVDYGTGTRTDSVDVSDECPTNGAGNVETMTLAEYRAAR